MKRVFIGITLLSFVMVAMIGCNGFAGLKFKSPTQQQVAKLAVSIGAKAIGLKLRSVGFVWTDEIEMFYRMITAKDQISIDAARLAEGYIRENVDPLIAPDVLELAEMVGFEFDPEGHVTDTANVQVDLLKTAAIGFRLAIVGYADPVAGAL